MTPKLSVKRYVFAHINQRQRNEQEYIVAVPDKVRLERLPDEIIEDGAKAWSEQIKAEAAAFIAAANRMYADSQTGEQRVDHSRAQHPDSTRMCTPNPMDVQEL